MNNDRRCLRIGTAAKITKLLNNYNRHDANYIIKMVYENRGLLQKLHFSEL